MRLALAQLNAVVGDLAGNRALIVDAIRDARAAGADLVLFPELAVTGYPPEDLLLRPGFVKAARASLEEITAATEGITALVGCPLFDRDLANACAVLGNGALRGVYRKHFLPNYGVFDEHRYFAAGRELVLLRCGEVLIGPTICEDIWQPGPPATDLSLAGAQLIVNLSASPFHVGKAEDREEMLVTRARDNASYLAFCNLVGGQDELVFDGHSVVLDDEGEVIARAPGFEEALLIVDLDPTEVIGRRLRDVRRRELERSRDEVPAATVIELPAPNPTGEAVAPSVTPFAPELEQMRLALGLGCARLRREERLPRGRRRCLGRDRLRPHRCDLRRCARGRAGARCLDALALLVGRDAGRRPRGCREPRHRLPRDPDRGRRWARSPTRSRPRSPAASPI